MDMFVRTFMHEHFTYRNVEVTSGAEALQLEAENGGVRSQSVSRC